MRTSFSDIINLAENAWDEKIRRFRKVLHASATAVRQFPMPISTLGGWHPDAHRAMGTIAVNIAMRASLHYARAKFF